MEEGTKSTLSRWELGEVLPTTDEVIHLDRTWNKNGALVSAVQQLQGLPEPTSGSQAARDWANNFPADWSGPVWELVRPVAPNRDERTYKIRVRWGPWQKSLRLRLEPSHTADVVRLRTVERSTSEHEALTERQLRIIDAVAERLKQGPLTGREVELLEATYRNVGLDW